MNNLIIPGGQVAGYFTISTDQRGVLAEFPNLITDGGLSRMAYSDYLSYCYVGTGSTPPTVNDTALVNRVGITSSIYSSSSNTLQTSAPYYATHINFYEFPIGAATGNLSEIGVGWLDAEVYKLFSRALILDAQGLPTTITILSTEILRVTYSLRMYIPTNDVSGTLNLTGNVGGTHNWTLRPARITTPSSWKAGQSMGGLYAYGSPFVQEAAVPRVFAYSSAMGTLFSAPDGSSTACSGTRGAYTSATWGVTTGDLSVRSLLLLCYIHGSYQVEFDPPIAKTSLQTLTLNWTNPTWGRYVAP